MTHSEHLLSSATPEELETLLWALDMYGRHWTGASEEGAVQIGERVLDAADQKIEMLNRIRDARLVILRAKVRRGELGVGALIGVVEDAPEHSRHATTGG